MAIIDFLSELVDGPAKSKIRVMEDKFEEKYVELCDTLDVSPFCSTEEFLRAASKYFYPNGVVYPPNRKERRRNKWKD